MGELPQLPERHAFLTTRLDSKEYMRAVRALEHTQKLIPSEDILALSRFSSAQAFKNKPNTAYTESYLQTSGMSRSNMTENTGGHSLPKQGV